MSEAIELVNPVRFIQATRDSGYRNVASALSELVDNSLQAGASQVDIFIDEDAGAEHYVAVLDDGCGMNQRQLSSALQFGGSDRFDDRSGMGRFGMGLPNSSLSQARRVDVYSWHNPKFVWHSYLDIDEILGAARPALDVPKRSVLPQDFRGRVRQTGTLVIWRTLDRVKVVNWNLMAKRLAHRLGQIFRYFLWEGRTVRINGRDVVPHDPLFLSRETRTPWINAEQYGKALEYQITVGEASPGRPPPYGYVIATHADITRGTYPPDQLGRYFVVEDKAALVRRLFESYASGTHSMPGLARALNQEGGPTPGGGRAWLEPTLRVILTNPVYKGEPASGKQRTVVDEGRLQQVHRLNGRPITRPETRVVRPPEEWVPLSAPPLVTADVWQAAQERMAQMRTFQGGNPRQVQMLSGKVYCPHCGSQAVVKHQKANGVA